MQAEMFVREKFLKERKCWFALSRASYRLNRTGQSRLMSSSLPETSVCRQLKSLPWLNKSDAHRVVR